MKRIIYVQNAIIAAEITVIAIISGFWGMHGGKLFVASLVLFAAVYWTALQVERAYLRYEKAGKAKGRGNTVPGIAWDKVRFRGSGKAHRDTRSNPQKVQEATRHNTFRTFIEDC